MTGLIYSGHLVTESVNLGLFKGTQADSLRRDLSAREQLWPERVSLAVFSKDALSKVSLAASQGMCWRDSPSGEIVAILTCDLAWG